MTLTDLPGPLRWAVWILAGEAVIAGLVAGFLVYDGIAAADANLGDAIAVAGFTAVIGVALAGLAAALSRRKARARAPAIVLQLLAVMLAYVLLTEGLVLLGAPLALIGIAIATLLLTPSTTAALD